jgi:hypothetical protein
MTQKSTLPVTKMSTRKLLGDKGRPALKVHDLTTICELIVRIFDAMISLSIELATMCICICTYGVGQD